MDLSHNRIIDIDTGVFAPLYRLYSLNLGHNVELVFGAEGAIFKNIEENLLHLNLENVSLTDVSNYSVAKYHLKFSRSLKQKQRVSLYTCALFDTGAGPTAAQPYLAISCLQLAAHRRPGARRQPEFAAEPGPLRQRPDSGAAHRLLVPQAEAPVPGLQPDNGNRKRQLLRGLRRLGGAGLERAETEGLRGWWF